MTRTSLTCNIFLALVVAVPMLAAPAKRHVVQRPSPGTEVTVKGTVLDAATSAPVVAADIVGPNGNASTDAQGKFEIKVNAGPTTLTASRSGYVSGSQTFTAVEGFVVTIRLTATATITLRESNGTTHQLDKETVKFAYLIPFSGYASSEKSNFCKPDGSNFTPDRTEFTRITGPAAPSTFAPCCTLGPVSSVTATMKSGETTVVYFRDNCFGNEVDFVGRDHTSGQFTYYNFANIAEIVFP